MPTEQDIARVVVVGGFLVNVMLCIASGVIVVVNNRRGNQIFWPRVEFALYMVNCVSQYVMIREFDPIRTYIAFILSTMFIIYDIIQLVYRLEVDPDGDSLAWFPLAGLILYSITYYFYFSFVILFCLEKPQNREYEANPNHDVENNESGENEGVRNALKTTE